jgi:hypothetical protein
MATATNGVAKFTPGFQVESIALKWTDGKEVSSPYSGDQIMYTLTDDRRWFADLYVADQIDALKLEPGEYFNVCKVEQRQGNSRTVRVVVSEIQEAAGAVQGKPAAPFTTSGQPPRRDGLAHSTSIASISPTVPSAAPAAKLNGAGETAADQLARCYRDAVDIALATQAYAKEKGLLLTPEFGDVRAMAATLSIAENGGRR